MNNTVLQANNDNMSGAWEFAAEGVTVTDHISFIASMQAADLNDPTLSIEVAMFGTTVPSGSRQESDWFEINRKTWTGGRTNPKTGQVVPLDTVYQPSSLAVPAIALRLSAMPNKNTRISVDVEVV